MDHVYMSTLKRRFFMSTNDQDSTIPSMAVNSPNESFRNDTILDNTKRNQGVFEKVGEVCPDCSSSEYVLVRIDGRDKRRCPKGHLYLPPSEVCPRCTCSSYILVNVDGQTMRQC